MLRKSAKPIEERSEGFAESNFALPALQELFQDVEFDEFDLEKLAESLLEDVSSNLEANVPASCDADAESQSRRQPLSEPLVGTDNSRMESTENISPIELLDDANDDLKLKRATFDETCKEGKIIYADDIPVEEECFEIHDTIAVLNTKPMNGLILPIQSYKKKDHQASPVHTISDYGYESHGSPLSHPDFSFGEQQDDLNYLLNDLFPALA